MPISSENYSPNNSTAILLQGAFGRGKTTFALKFPKPYIFDADNNLAGAVRATPSLVFEYDIGTLNEKGMIIESQRYTNMINMLNIVLKDPKYETIIIDSGSAVSDFIIHYILNKTGKASMTQADWGAYLIAWKQLLTKIRTFGKLIIFVVHEKLEKDELTQSIEYIVNLPGQIRDIIGTLFSDVWRLEVEQTRTQNGIVSKFQVRTAPTDKLKLKKSFPNLPDVFPANDVNIVLKEIAKYQKADATAQELVATTESVAEQAKENETKVLN